MPITLHSFHLFVLHLLKITRSFDTYIVVYFCSYFYQIVMKCWSSLTNCVSLPRFVLIKKSIPCTEDANVQYGKRHTCQHFVIISRWRDMWYDCCSPLAFRMKCCNVFYLFTCSHLFTTRMFSIYPVKCCFDDKSIAYSLWDSTQ